LLEDKPVTSGLVKMVQLRLLTKRPRMPGLLGFFIHLLVPSSSSSLMMPPLRCRRSPVDAQGTARYDLYLFLVTTTDCRQIRAMVDSTGHIEKRVLESHHRLEVGRSLCATKGVDDDGFCVRLSVYCLVFEGVVVPGERREIASPNGVSPVFSVLIFVI
jgi:hypothetical protein